MPTHSSDYKPKKEEKIKSSEGLPKGVIQIDIATGQELNRFNSLIEGAKFLIAQNVAGNEPKPKSVSCNIGRVCNGKRKTAYGYKWKFIEEENI